MRRFEQRDCLDPGREYGDGAFCDILYSDVISAIERQQNEHPSVQPERVSERILQSVKDYCLAHTRRLKATDDLLESLTHKLPRKKRLNALFDAERSARRSEEYANQRLPKELQENRTSMAAIGESWVPSGLDDKTWSGLSDF